MKTRFAPSPTGFLHIGGARTALFSWLWARQQHGKFVLRIEDTDLARSTQDSMDAILAGMHWLGLDYDEGPFYQTDKFPRYKAIIQQLLDNNQAYYCECSKTRLQTLRETLMANGEKAKYDGRCRDKNLSAGVVRFQNPASGLVQFSDAVKGQISIANQELDDLIIARSDGTPTYNLTVVVDDHDMQIDTVIRGDDHINNTPRQINLYRALDWELPSFAHLPMILGSDGVRLSKRHGAMSVMAYRDAGFLPEVLLNYLVRLGWSYGDQEIFSVPQMIELFDLSNINKAPASFNEEKLLWLNQTYIKQMSAADLWQALHWHLSRENLEIEQNTQSYLVIDFVKERCKTLLEMTNRLKMFYQNTVELDPKLAKKHFKNKPLLAKLWDKLSQLNDWQASNIKQVIAEVCREFEVGFGKVGQPLRLAISGDGNIGSIDLATELVGKTRTLARLKSALTFDT